MRFIDLFCGIGGFHHALSTLGHECVFACDIDEHCREIYQKNWDMTAFSDIRDWVDEIDEHDLLCAGFPCQPFSKSGSQLGFMDKTRGTLFGEICKIIEKNQPKYVLLENVANLRSHDNGVTIKTIRSSLQELNYFVKDKILSPHEFGVPHHRPRLFIVAIHRDKVPNYQKFKFPVAPSPLPKTHVDTLFDVESEGKIGEDLVGVLDHWSKFMQSLPRNVKPPSPTWSMEFGRTYPLDEIHPISGLTKKQLVGILDSEGIFASAYWTKDKILKKFPPYIRKMKQTMPSWKRNFILRNRSFWENHGTKVGTKWLGTTRTFSETFQKFEWHVGNSPSRDVMDYMIHTRPSGIRVSKLDKIPALVAMTQIPIIGPWGRKLSPREAANAQSFSSDFDLHDTDNIAFKQLGNSVNVHVVELLAERMLDLSKPSHERHLDNKSL